MKNIIKRLSAFIIVALVIISLMPVTAKAEDTYTLYARVPSHWGVPNIWAWSDAGENVFEAWPGQAMTGVGDGEWYSVELPVSATNVLINYNGDSYKTNDIKVNGSDVWITVFTDNSTAIDYTKPSKLPSDSGEEGTGNMVNLVTRLPADWTYPYVWLWNDEGKNVYKQWPGEAMDIQENGAATKRIPDWVTGIKISAKSSTDGRSVETGDIFIDAGRDVYITVYTADNLVVMYGDDNSDKPNMPSTGFENVTTPIVENTTPYTEYTTPYTEYTTPYSDDMNGGAPTIAPDDGENGKNNAGFFKFFIPVVCVVVIIVVVVATRKSTNTEE